MMLLEKFDGLLPEELRPVTRKIFLKDFDLPVDIGFHEFEVGRPQRLRINIEVWVHAEAFPVNDRAEDAWDYDFLRTAIHDLVGGRRFNLQETLVRDIYEVIAARRGVRALRVSTRKLDVYPDCGAVGVELCSF